MSSLAPFVAAALRDKVVKEQQEEIHDLRQYIQQLEGKTEALERRLKEKDPMRAVQLVIGDTVHLSNTLDANVVDEENGADLFPMDSALCVSLETLMTAKLVIDGQVAIVLGDLNAVSERYSRCDYAQENHMYLRLEHGPDFVMHAYVGPIARSEYCNVLRISPEQFEPRESPIGCTLYDEADRPCCMKELMRIAPTMITKSNFDDGCCRCSGEFFFHHLEVPYAP